MISLCIKYALRKIYISCGVWCHIGHLMWRHVNKNHHQNCSGALKVEWSKNGLIIDIFLENSLLWMKMNLDDRKFWGVSKFLFIYMGCVVGQAEPNDPIGSAKFPKPYATTTQGLFASCSIPSLASFLSQTRLSQVSTSQQPLVWLEWLLKPG